MSYTQMDVPEPLGFIHIDDDINLLTRAIHARDLIPFHTREMLTWPNMRFIGGCRVRRFGLGVYESKSSYRVNLARGLR